MDIESHSHANTHTITESNGNGRSSKVTRSSLDNGVTNDNLISRDNDQNRLRNKQIPNGNIINQINEHLSANNINNPWLPKNSDDWLSNNNRNNINVNQQKRLDEWLNETMKDSPKTFSSSSVEFLDGPRIGLNGGIMGSAGNGSTISANTLSNSLRPDLQQNAFPFGMNLDASPYYPVPNFPAIIPSFTLQNQHSDFTSLPPAVNLDINKSNSQNDLLDGLNNRRFSDPCLAGISDDDTANGKQTDKNNSNNQSDQTKLLAYLIKQINVLHETNSKIYRNLHDTKVDIEALRHAPSWNLRHRRDSISGFSTHSQPIGNPFGAHSPAPTYHSGMYTPGMMTDVVRELKEGARVREEALLSRARAMIEERSWSMNETHLKIVRELEELRIQINQLKSEKLDSKSHISKLEEEIKSLRTLLTHVLSFNRSNQAFMMPNMNYAEQAVQRPNFTHNSPPDYQKRQNLNLNYGVINQDDGNAGVNPSFLNESDNLRPLQNELSEIIRNEKTNFANLNGSSSSDNNSTLQYNGIYTANDTDGQIIQMEKDNLKLRLELQDALANRKHADRKIQTLENLVKNLQTKSSTTINSTPDNNNTIVTITTAHSSTVMNSDALSNKPQPQVATQIQTITPKPLPNNNNTSTINVPGLVTDL